MNSCFAHKKLWVAIASGTALLAALPSVEARVTRIVIDQTLSQPAVGGAQTVAYQTLNGRAFGELCISGCVGAANNTIITDLMLAPIVPGTHPDRWSSSTSPASR